jgi:hypothetical protein
MPGSTFGWRGQRPPSTTTPNAAARQGARLTDLLIFMADFMAGWHETRGMSRGEAEKWWEFVDRMKAEPEGIAAWRLAVTNQPK